MDIQTTIDILIKNYKLGPDDVSVGTNTDCLALEGTPNGFRFLAEVLILHAENAEKKIPEGCFSIIAPQRKHDLQEQELPKLSLRGLYLHCHASADTPPSH